MAVASLLQVLVLVLLALSLAVFLVELLVSALRHRSLARDFGVAFSAFLAAWIATELVATFAPPAWAGADEVLHFAVLVAFAGWMNVRWRWAVRRAREGP